MSTGNAFATAEALELPLLDDPQELCLQGERQIADLIEKERAAVGELDLAVSALNTRGDALFDTEELRLEQRFRECRAIERDKGPVERSENECSSRATRSLPTPDSPRSRTLTPVGAARAHQLQHLVDLRRLTHEALASCDTAQGAVLVGETLAFAFDGVDSACGGDCGGHHAGHREQKPGVTVGERRPSLSGLLVRQHHHAHQSLLPEHGCGHELERWFVGGALCARPPLRRRDPRAGGSRRTTVTTSTFCGSPIGPDDGLLSTRVEGADKAGAGVEGADRPLQQLFNQLFLGQHAADGQRQIDQGLELEPAPVAIEGVHF